MHNPAMSPTNPIRAPTQEYWLTVSLILPLVAAQDAVLSSVTFPFQVE